MPEDRRPTTDDQGLTTNDRKGEVAERLKAAVC